MQFKFTSCLVASPFLLVKISAIAADWTMWRQMNHYVDFKSMFISSNIFVCYKGRFFACANVHGVPDILDVG